MVKQPFGDGHYMPESAPSFDEGESVSSIVVPDGEELHSTGENTAEQLIARGVSEQLARTIGDFHELGIEVDMDAAYEEMDRASNNT